MMRLCLFGTSHLAALRMAYQAEPDRWPEFEITFVGATGAKLLDHVINDGVMTPTSPDLQRSFQLMAGVEALDLRQFDAFALSGCQIGPHMIGHIYGQARWLGLPSLQRAGIPGDPHWSLMSETAIDAVLQHRIMHSIAGVLAPQLSGASEKPVLVVSSPRPDETLMNLQKHKLIAQKRAVRQGDAAHLSDRYDGLARDCFRRIGVDYLPQPPHTIRDHMLTRSIYMEGAVKLTPRGVFAQPDHDIMHGNAAYGAAVLDQITAALSDVEE